MWVSGRGRGGRGRDGLGGFRVWVSPDPPTQHTPFNPAEHSTPPPLCADVENFSTGVFNAEAAASVTGVASALLGNAKGDDLFVTDGSYGQLSASAVAADSGVAMAGVSDAAVQFGALGVAQANASAAGGGTATANSKLESYALSDALVVTVANAAGSKAAAADATGRVYAEDGSRSASVARADTNGW